MRKQACGIAAIFCVVTAAVASYAYAETQASWLLITACCAIGILLICLGVFLYDRRNAAPHAARVYKRKAQYLTPAERDFLYVLRTLVGKDYEVFAQVPLVAAIDKVSGGAFRNELFRVADYLIAHPVTYAPLLLIELNDASHLRADRRERDRKVAAICADADLPLITFTVQEAKNVPEVRKKIYGVLRKYK